MQKAYGKADKGNIHRVNICCRWDQDDGAIEGAIKYSEFCQNARTARCWWCLLGTFVMDPYHNPIDPEQPTEEDFGEDHLRALERELAPQATDYYGILNVSKTVRK